MLDENIKLSLRELAYLCALTIKEAEEEVCDCDPTYGYICEYHTNPNAKHTLKEWREMSVIGNDYASFITVNDIERYPKTKRLEK